MKHLLLSLQNSALHSSIHYPPQQKKGPARVPCPAAPPRLCPRPARRYMGEAPAAGAARPSPLAIKAADFFGVEHDFHDPPVAGEPAAEKSETETDRVFQLLSEQDELQRAWKSEKVPAVRGLIEKELRSLQDQIDALAEDIHVERSPPAGKKGADPFDRPTDAPRAPRDDRPRDGVEFVPAATDLFLDEDHESPEQRAKLLQLQAELEALLKDEKDNEARALLLQELMVLERRLAAAGVKLKSTALARAAQNALWANAENYQTVFQGMFAVIACLAWWLSGKTIDWKHLGHNDWLELLFSDD